MPEIDFISSQIRKDDDRSTAERVRDRLELTGYLVFFFILFLIGLAIKDAYLLMGYLALVGAGAFMWRKLPRLDQRFRDLVQVHKGQMVLVMSVLLAVYPLIFAHDAYLVHLGALAGIFVIVALGLNITLGFAGLLDVGFAVYFAAGAYTSAQLAVIWDVDFWVGLPLGGLVAAFFGFLVAWPALRVKGHYLAMVTLGYGLMMNILHRNLKGVTNGTDGVINIPAPTIFGHDFLSPITVFGFTLPFQTNFYYLTLILIAITMLISYRLLNSNIGRRWEAMREDDVAAHCFGIDLTFNKVLAFSTGAFFGGIGGAVFAHMIGFVHPDNFILLTSITILAMVLIGGMGSIWGVALGAVLLIMIPERLRDFEVLRMLLFGLSMALIMIFRPQGLFPSQRRRRELESARVEELIKASGKENAHVRPVD